jgi:hypothetical protein
MKRNAAICGVALATLALSAGLARGDIMVKLDPSSSIVTLGDTFTVNILADIEAADAIVGWGIDVVFDLAFLSHNPASDVTIGPAFGAALVIPDGDELAGLVPFGFPPAPPVFGTDVLLATMTFQAIGLGTSSLVGGITALDPTEGFVKPGSPGTVLVPASFADGSVTVVPVPAPTATLLGLVGLSAVALVQRRAA